MRANFGEEVERARCAHPTLPPTARGANYGWFVFTRKRAPDLRVMVRGDGEGWDHVSVSTAIRPPRWAEMCRIKDLFFEPDEWVVQYHPAVKDYVNFHANTLHLWRPVGVEIPKPPEWMV